MSPPGAVVSLVSPAAPKSPAGPVGAGVVTAEVVLVVVAGLVVRRRCGRGRRWRRRRVCDRGRAGRVRRRRDRDVRCSGARHPRGARAATAGAGQPVHATAAASAVVAAPTSAATTVVAVCARAAVGRRPVTAVRSDCADAARAAVAPRCAGAAEAGVVADVCLTVTAVSGHRPAVSAVAVRHSVGASTAATAATRDRDPARQRRCADADRDGARDGAKVGRAPAGAGKDSAVRARAVPGCCAGAVAANFYIEDGARSHGDRGGHVGALPPVPVPSEALPPRPPTSVTSMLCTSAGTVNVCSIPAGPKSTSLGVDAVAVEPSAREPPARPRRAPLRPGSERASNEQVQKASPYTRRRAPSM